MDKGGRLVYYPFKTISFFPSYSYVCFEIFVKEIKLFSQKMEIISTFLTLMELHLKKYFLEFNSLYCDISLQTPKVDDYNSKVVNDASFVPGLEGQGKSLEKEPSIIREDKSISLSLSSFSLSHEISLK
ncbi:hypothetical protein M9H77_21761 [Catharanthus roseus]|uniref:Uncharacterized protein n=1 Tax=Catharanthus roseus TaxID=4058 RepID=A0ACC0ASM9_CATRO|nr:hypothetical protein M9H77_21761 [Catharanthus roseus]